MSEPRIYRRQKTTAYIPFEINAPLFMEDDFTNLRITPLGRMATSITLFGEQCPEVHVNRFDTRVSDDDRNLSFDALLLGHARPFPDNTTGLLKLPIRGPIVPIAFELLEESGEAKVIEIRPSLRDPLFDLQAAAR